MSEWIDDGDAGQGQDLGHDGFGDAGGHQHLEQSHDQLGHHELHANYGDEHDQLAAHQEFGHQEHFEKDEHFAHGRTVEYDDGHGGHYKVTEFTEYSSHVEADSSSYGSVSYEGEQADFGNAGDSGFGELGEFGGEEHGSQFEQLESLFTTNLTDFGSGDNGEAALSSN